MGSAVFFLTDPTLEAKYMQSTAAGVLLILPLCILVGANEARAAAPAHIDGTIGAISFTLTAPETMQEMLAELKHPKSSPLAIFGAVSDDVLIGFRQTALNADGSSVAFTLLLPEEAARSLKPGSYKLGGATLHSISNGSNDGWDGTCPDDQEAKPIVIISHYRTPGAGEPAVSISTLPSNLDRQLQTHQTRIRQDVAELTITTVDRAGGYVEGEAHGDVSMISPKDNDDTNNHKSYHWMCRAGEYNVATEHFEVHFRLEIDKRLKPVEPVSR